MLIFKAYRGDDVMEVISSIGGWLFFLAFIGAASSRYEQIVTAMKGVS